VIWKQQVATRWQHACELDEHIYQVCTYETGQLGTRQGLHEPPHTARSLCAVAQVQRLRVPPGSTAVHVHLYALILHAIEICHRGQILQLAKGFSPAKESHVSLIVMKDRTPQHGHDCGDSTVLLQSTTLNGGTGPETHTPHAAFYPSAAASICDRVG
jgi:hypothetical protein